MKPLSPPENENTLLQRAQKLTGRSLKEIAQQHNFVLPENFLRHKGWLGQLVEFCLGATAGNAAEPDFPHLGIELKTIPVDAHGHPKETTYITRVPLMEGKELQWETCTLYQKIKRVLWIPVEADPNIAIPQRRIGTPLLWYPSNTEKSALRKDWEEFADLICMGKIDSISAHQGTFIQIRPKAANSRCRHSTVGESGEWKATLPRGYYLRTGFTKQILTKYFIA